jgi:hypothetical protein
MAQINPAPAQLGLASPVLGPWFGDPGATLAAPGPRLSVSHTFANATTWLPPAIGTLSLLVATSPRPAALAPLTDALGAAAFGDATGSDTLVAVFTLLPEIEERLEVLSGLLPRPDGVATPAPVAALVRARARVRSIAIEFANAAPTLLDLFVNPLETGNDPGDFGLATGADGNLANGPTPMADLRRPERLPPLQVQPLANFPVQQQVTLWAFDAEGVALDIGAVATWWLAIASGGQVAPWAGPSNLWADNGDRRTCAVQPNLGFRLVNPHRGALDATTRGRLNLPANATAVPGNPDLYSAAQAGGAQLAFGNAPPPPAPDALPVPLMAMLPLGSYGATLNLWNGGPLTVARDVPVDGGGTVALARDHVEVAVLDVEAFLTGTPRTGADPPVSAADRRAADQNRPSTRINVARTQVALLPTIDAVAAAFNALPNGTDAIAMLAPAFDHDWGERRITDGLPPLAVAGTLPAVLPPIDAFALEGGGAADDGTVDAQQVVMRLALAGSTNLTGAWVRIYPQQIDPETGRRTPQPGGAGRFGSAAASGTDIVAHVVVTLPRGRIDSAATLGVDVLLVDLNNPNAVPRVYADQRIARPAPVGGTALAYDDLGPTDLLLVCDLGQESSPGAIQIPPGATLLRRAGDAYALIDRTSVPLSVFDSRTFAPNLTAADRIAVTTPAFAAAARGDTNPAAGTPAGAQASVDIQGRNGIANLFSAGAPLPAQDRLELVAVRGGANPAAVVGSAPALATWHELLPTQAGNPAAPGGPEAHGAGAQLTGGAATDAAEFVRDRRFAASDALVNDAVTNPLPANATAAPAQWAAVLKTVARGVEGEPGLYEGFGLGGDALFDAYDDAVAWFRNLPTPVTLPPPGSNAAAGLRAVNRRILGALGRQEALFALDAALRRAERLIYVETPAIDSETVAADGARIAWLATLIAQLGAKPALRVALCVPQSMLPGTPPPLAWVRSEAWQQALAALLAAANERVVIFSPGAGPYSHARMASTVVIVDDVWAMVGTTHLWRRGLSFDSSLAVTVFDETSLFGRGSAIAAFRMQLAADRLGVTINQIPLVSRDFFATLRQLVANGGNGRLATGSIARSPAGERPTATDIRLWNRDGSISGDADLAAWLPAIASQLTAS